MSRFLILFFGLSMTLTGSLSSEVINQPVINVFISPEENSEVDSQAIYGNSVVVIEEEGTGWTKIRMQDGVEGFIRSTQITRNEEFEKSTHLRPLKNLFAHIYRVSDTSTFPPLLTIPYGSKIKLINVVDDEERWIPVELVSGERAWIQRGDVDFAPRLKTLEETLVFSTKFLGLPYTWGGTSSYGFDCSGFVQMLCKEMGLILPRNSRDQANCKLLTPVSREDLQRGDLIFFGEGRITHVGFYLGNNEILYSGVRGGSPTIMVDHLQTTKYHYISARRILQP